MAQNAQATSQGVFKCVSNAFYSVGEKANSLQQRTSDWCSANLVGAKKVTHYLRTEDADSTAKKALKFVGMLLAILPMLAVLGTATLAKWAFNKGCDGLSWISKNLFGSTQKPAQPAQPAGQANPAVIAPVIVPREGAEAASAVNPEAEPVPAELQEEPAPAPVEATGTEGAPIVDASVEKVD